MAMMRPHILHGVEHREPRRAFGRDHRGSHSQAIADQPDDCPVDALDFLARRGEVAVGVSCRCAGLFTNHVGLLSKGQKKRPVD